MTVERPAWRTGRAGLSVLATVLCAAVAAAACGEDPARPIVTNHVTLEVSPGALAIAPGGSAPISVSLLVSESFIEGRIVYTFLPAVPGLRPDTTLTLAMGAFDWDAGPGRYDRTVDVQVPESAPAGTHVLTVEVIIEHYCGQSVACEDGDSATVALEVVSAAAGRHRPAGESPPSSP